jgi:hypothetical protein
VERGERVNVGVLLYCPGMDVLGARTHLDPHRLHALDPELDLAQVRAQLDAVEAECAELDHLLRVLVLPTGAAVSPRPSGSR